ncbi:uncharacterized protein LOC106671077 [Cimex lectularius]|uniref:Uncharacterized protein n=1 Tax=Cimex lectularius TaxID=79782 RepID=A0A8I6S3H5_CIMLE|nr:uncharacterized protein LOC106671077 [Cimex lectularius]
MEDRRLDDRYHFGNDDEVAELPRSSRTRMSPRYAGSVEYFPLESYNRMVYSPRSRQRAISPRSPRSPRTLRSVECVTPSSSVGCRCEPSPQFIENSHTPSEIPPGMSGLRRSPRYSPEIVEHRRPEAMEQSLNGISRSRFYCRHRTNRVSNHNRYSVTGQQDLSETSGSGDSSIERDFGAVEPNLFQRMRLQKKSRRFSRRYVPDQRGETNLDSVYNENTLRESRNEVWFERETYSIDENYDYSEDNTIPFVRNTGNRVTSPSELRPPHTNFTPQTLQSRAYPKRLSVSTSDSPRTC